MTAYKIDNPFEYFSDTAGNALEGGAIYIGTAGLDAETNPIPVYFDADETIPATQPIATTLGYPTNGGSAVTIYTANTYSITVRDSNGAIVYSSVIEESDGSQVLSNTARLDQMDEGTFLDFDPSTGTLTPTATGNTFSGADNSIKMSDATEWTVENEFGTLEFGQGLYRMSNDVSVFGSPDQLSGGKMTLKGLGASTFQPFSRDVGSADVTFMGTVLAFDAGSKMNIQTGRRGTLFEDMTIVGSVDGDVLIDDAEDTFNGFMTAGGGFSDCLIINDNRSAVADGTQAIRTSAVYLGKMSHTQVYGRPDFRIAWNDSALDNSELFFGQGLRITGQGQGSQGDIHDVTFSGFDVGQVMGYSVALAPNSNSMASYTMHRPQWSYCNVGLRHRRGAGRAILNDVSIEQIARAGVWVSGDAEDLCVFGGSSGSPTRVGPTGNQKMEFAPFTIGSPTATESIWSHVLIKDHNFGINTKSGAFVFGGQGRATIDNPSIGVNGGYLLAIDDETATSVGVPDIIIRGHINPRKAGIARPDYNRIVALASRFDAGGTATPYDDLRIINSDARYLIRIEGSNNDDSGIGYGSDIRFPHDVELDMGVRPNPPERCFWAFDVGQTGVITLGNATPVGMETTHEKRTGNGTLDIVIPAGTTLTDPHGVVRTGETISITQPGTIRTLVRNGPDDWLALQPLTIEESGSFTGDTSTTGVVNIPHNVGDTPITAFISLIGSDTNYAKVQNVTSTNIVVKVRDAADANLSETSVTIQWVARL